MQHAGGNPARTGKIADGHGAESPPGGAGRSIGELAAVESVAACPAPAVSTVDLDLLDQEVRGSDRSTSLITPA